jgi:hypothetical protein
MKLSYLFMFMTALAVGGRHPAARADDHDHQKQDKWLKERRKQAEKAAKEREKWYKHHGNLSKQQREWLEDERERREDWLEERRERYEDWQEDQRERREEWWEDHGRDQWRGRYDYAPSPYRSPFYSPPRSYFNRSPYRNYDYDYDHYARPPRGVWFRW